jgi:hypothetical protein
MPDWYARGVQALPILFTLGLLSLVAWASMAGRARRRGVLGQLAGHLGGQAGGNDVRGTLDGIGVHLRFATRGSGSNQTRWTYVDCPLPPAYPLAIHLQDHGWFDRGKIDRGAMVDVEIGHPAFDEKFRVEAAPADVVRRMLTPAVREYLLAQGEVELATEDGALRLAIRGWLEKVEAAQEAIAITVGLVSAVRAGHHAADAEVPRPIVGGAYRGFADEAPLHAARAARADEVARVEAVRRKRNVTQTLLGVVIVLAIGGMIATVFVSR